ncbi:MAG: hypothetical protein LBI13_02375 [Streptococcaceae bacterium]|jgi:hypothetical protein|nr:hypothetical protein [Streptococcaceae bacterium]
MFERSKQTDKSKQPNQSNQNNRLDATEKKLESFYDAASKVLSVSLNLSDIAVEFSENSESQRSSESYSLIESESKSVKKIELQSEIASTSSFLSDSDSESMSVIFKEFDLMAKTLKQYGSNSKELSSYLVASEQSSMMQSQQTDKINEYHSVIASNEMRIAELESLAEVNEHNIVQFTKNNQTLAKTAINSESMQRIHSLSDPERVSESESGSLSHMSSTSQSVYEWYSLIESEELKYSQGL